jgi:Zn-dependent protease with chaperone function
VLDFFEQQARARRRTAGLVAVYVVGLVVFVCVVAPVLMCFSVIVASATLGNDRDSSSGRVAAEDRNEWNRLAATMASSPLETFGSPEGRLLWAISGGFTIGMVLVASAYKTVALRGGGGKLVAESVGGRLLVRGGSGTRDFHDQRVMNVVEEMAIAAGVPVPPVYVLDKERGINAFAAGYSASDAVIAVTAGAAQTLTREQLQGVIGHEFSHILNGDMRLNIRLIGMLYGVLSVQLLARVFFTIARAAVSDGDKGSLAIGAVFGLFGLILLLLGLTGAMVARVVKAAIGREREYLADASSAQFTRNPGGLAAALRVVGGNGRGGELVAGGAEEYSHLYFVGGVSGWLAKAMDTHPPLRERIRRLDPSWDGTWLAGEDEVPGARDEGRGEELGVGLVGGYGVSQAPPRSVGVPKAEPLRSVEIPGTIALADATRHVGALTPEEVFVRVESAREVLGRIPPRLLDAARDAHDARALVLGLVMDSREGAREAQLGVIASGLGKDVAESSERLDDVLRGLGAGGMGVRMPLLQVALAAMASLSAAQYAAFRETMRAVLAAQRKSSLFKACVERMVVVHLDRRFGVAKPPAVQYYALTRLGEECSLLLSAGALTAGMDAGVAGGAISGASSRLGFEAARVVAAKEITAARLQQALAVLATVSPKLRVGLVRAMAEIIGTDGRVTPQEAELLRVVADSLDVPIALRMMGGA